MTRQTGKRRARTTGCCFGLVDVLHHTGLLGRTLLGRCPIRALMRGAEIDTRPGSCPERLGRFAQDRYATVPHRRAPPPSARGGAPTRSSSSIGQKNQLRHQLHGVTGRSMLAGFLSVDARALDNAQSQGYFYWRCRRSENTPPLSVTNPVGLGGNAERVVTLQSLGSGLRTPCGWELRRTVRSPD